MIREAAGLMLAVRLRAGYQGEHMVSSPQVPTDPTLLQRFPCSVSLEES